MRKKPTLVPRHFRPHPGWFKVWRKLFENDIWLTKPPSWLKVFIAILGNTGFDERTIRVGNSDIQVPKGSFILGLDEFSAFCGVTKQQLRSTIRYLVATQVITLTTTSRFTILTVRNWEAYQGSDADENTPSNTPKIQTRTQKASAEEHNRNTPENTPENSKIRSKEIKKRKPSCPTLFGSDATGDSDEEYAAAHDRFYAAYWKHVNKPKSLAAFQKRVGALVKQRHITPEAAIDFLISEAKADKARWEHTKDWEWRKNLMPATWLNNCRWEDEAPSTAQANPPSQPTPSEPKPAYYREWKPPAWMTQ